MKRYHNKGREHALTLLRSKQYTDLEHYLREAVVFQRRQYDQFYEFLHSHGTGRMYKEEDASR